MLADAYVDKIRKNLSPEIKQRAGKIDAEEARQLAEEKAQEERKKPRKRPTAALLSRRSARFAKPSALVARAVHPRARLAPSSRSIRLRRHP